jgi:2-C-methyl-D-erythritol 4-phosphate cytidylyltransferase
MRTVAVLLAGGVGTRVGAQVPKQLIEIGGRPVMEHALATFDAHPGIDEVVVMMAAGHVQAARVLARPYAKVSQVLEGADTRNGTTLRALDAIGDDVRVLLHDAARPLVSARIVTGCLAALDSYDAVTTAIPSADTIVHLDDHGLMDNIPVRDRMRRVQTPQGFRASTLRTAYAFAAEDPDFAATDDCGVVLRYTPDVPIAVVEGDERNLKVTGPLDVAIAELLLERGVTSGGDTSHVQ